MSKIYYVNDKTKMFYEGSNYWLAYVKLNGYAFCPNENGLTKLSRNLDLDKSYLRRCINIYLES